MKSFEEASEFLETFLANFGMDEYCGDEFSPASGELLFQAFQSFGEIEYFVKAKEPEIIKRLGDRREKFESNRTPPMAQLPGYRYLRGMECFGRTSHSCGVVVMLNLINAAFPLGDPSRDIDQSATWKTLPNPDRQRIGLCERSFSTWGGAVMLAEGVNYERTAIQDDNDWLTITKVGKGLGINKGCVGRLVDTGCLRDNGKTGTPRRINPASVIEYCEKEGIAYNDT